MGLMQNSSLAVESSSCTTTRGASTSQKERDDKMWNSSRRLSTDPVEWKSKMQATTTTSSGEVEATGIMGGARTLAITLRCQVTHSSYSMKHQHETQTTEENCICEVPQPPSMVHPRLGVRSVRSQTVRNFGNWHHQGWLAGGFLAGLWHCHTWKCRTRPTEKQKTCGFLGGHDQLGHCCVPKLLEYGSAKRKNDVI